MDVGRRLSNLLVLDRRGVELRWSYVGAGLVGIVRGLVAAVRPEIIALGADLVVGGRAVVAGALQIAAAAGVFALPPGAALPWSPWLTTRHAELVPTSGDWPTSTR